MSNEFYNEVDLNALGLRTTGRPAKKLAFHITRELTQEDHLATLEDRSKPEGKQVIQRLRNKHHRLARLLAEGVPQNKAAIASGYSPGRVSFLKNDPAFRELVTFYKGKVEQEYYDMHAAMSDLGQDAVAELAERLEEDPTEFTIPQLLDISKTMADRTGYGPTQKTEVDVKVGLAERLENARKRALENRLIEATAIDVTPDAAE